MYRVRLYISLFLYVHLIISNWVDLLLDGSVSSFPITWNMQLVMLSYIQTFVQGTAYFPLKAIKFIFKQYIKFYMCLRHFHSVQLLCLCYRLNISFCNSFTQC